MKKILLLLFIFLVGAALLTYSFFLSNAESGEAGKNNLASLPGNDRENVDATPNDSLPQTLIIPSLDVSAKVEYVGMDAKRNMDVPKDDMNVAWYELGFTPGIKGNAVMAGHLDRATGAPAVFYNLERLKTGDTLIVRMRDGTELTYAVTGKATYPNERFPLVEVFGPHEKSRLNLITCEGSYDRSARNYSHRTVVYSELQE